MALTGFWVNGVCTDSQASAVAAINSQFPVVGDSFIHTGSAIASGTVAVKLTVYTFNLGLSGGVWLSHVLTYSLTACDPVLYPSTIFDPLAAASFWLLALTFTLGCWLMAKNAGVILSAIRRF